MKCIIVVLCVSCLFVHWANAQYESGRLLKAELMKNHKAIVASENSKIEIIDLNKTFLKTAVNGSDVTYYFSTNSVQNKPSVQINTIDDIKNTKYDPNRRTMFIVHGWQNKYDSPVNILIRTALYDSGDEWNVFVVSWETLAAKDYFTAAGAVSGIGDVVATFIEDLIALTGLNVDKTQLVGHSLGAHICGRVGAQLNDSIPIIVGLDAAGPLFDNNNIDERLDPTDGQYVQAIHTSSQFLGMERNLGHSDYYPNGGSVQNGCGSLDVAGVCAHSRAYMYFAESLTNNKFVSASCNNADDWKNQKCLNGSKANMGGNVINISAQGSYYLDTNGDSLYAKG